MRASDNDPISTLSELVAQRARQEPDTRVLVYLDDGVRESDWLTYERLHREALATAAALLERCAPGGRVLLLFPPGLGFITAFFGCLYAGLIAVPAYPPKRNQKASRLLSIFEDAAPNVILATSGIIDSLQDQAGLYSHFCDAHCLAADQIDSGAGVFQVAAVPPKSHDIALLQYTSGSTAMPKGVMVTHANLTANCEYIRRAFELAPGQSRSVSWLPSYHDMGLIDGILQPIYTGFTGYLMPAALFFRRPLLWLEAIARVRATHSGGPDFAYRLCVRATTPEQRAGPDLSSWTSAYNGAEPVRASTLDLFASAFASCGFRRSALYPCYGMAEATLMVSGGSVNQIPTECVLDASGLEGGLASDSHDQATKSVRLVSSGRVYGETNVVIADPATLERLPDNHVGEIWVSSPSVAAGYWNSPSTTRDTFSAFLRPSGEGPFLRSGDLGFLRGGDLYVTGRSKDLLIFRGRNHYPQDIELTAEESHPGLRGSSNAAFAVDIDGAERLVIVQELERREIRHLDVSMVAAGIRRAIVREHDVQPYAVVLLAPGKIFKTSSGKIQRHACKQAFLAGTLDPLAVSTLPVDTDDVGGDGDLRRTLLAMSRSERTPHLEAYLRILLGNLLGLTPQQVELDRTATDVGLDSLGIARLRHCIETELGVLVSTVDVLEYTSLLSLLDRVAGQLTLPQETEPVPAPEKVENGCLDTPLSHGQRALWFLHQMQPKSSAYNVALVADVLSAVNPQSLARAFEAVVARHAALRTQVVMLDGRPRQRIRAMGPADFVHVDVHGCSEQELNDEISSTCEIPFDLEAGGLIRVRLYTAASDRHTLLVIAHHIVMDLWSLEIFVDELTEAYTAFQSGRPPCGGGGVLPFQQYVAWQERFLNTDQARAHAKYWFERLSGSRPTLALPYEQPKKAGVGGRGGVQRFAIDSTMTAQIRHFAKLHGVTAYMLLLAVFKVQLYRYTGQSDISVGSSVDGRSEASFANTIGYLANQVVIRSNMRAGMRFADFLATVRRSCLGAWAHQDYPFQAVVEVLSPARAYARSPLFDVMFGLIRPPRLPGLGRLATQLPGATVELNGLRLASRVLDRGGAQFDLMLTVVDAEDSLAACWEFDADLFGPSTIERMHGHWLTLLNAALRNPCLPIDRMPLLTEPEKEQVLVKCNSTAAHLSHGHYFHELFEECTDRAPQAPAVVDPSVTLSYADVNRRANRLARRLREFGVAPGTLVGICLRRHAALIVSVLAVMKAGAAYVPLDPGYPSLRLIQMLEDAKPLVLLTEVALAPQFLAGRSELLCVDSESDRLAGYSDGNLGTQLHPSDLAYVIYTSGSTGGPKGVMVTHAGLMNYLVWSLKAYDLSSGCGAAVSSSFGFDATLTGLMCPLVAGGKVLLLPEGDEMGALGLALRGVERFSLIKLTPAHLEILRSHFPRASAPVATNAFVVGGEALAPATMMYWREHSPDTRIINEYGPTETVVGCCVHEVTATSDLSWRVPIGRPISNTRMYILDAYNQPVPLGVIGEIYIAGLGVARGYLNRPELTADRFVADPFSSLPGARMYRSGDLGRWLPSGDIVYSGRNDFQAKIRGFRVELGEVEAALLEHPDVREAAVTVYQGIADERYLVAHVVCTESVVAQDRARQRADLERRLPNHMVPTRWAFHRSLPLTTNGKIDRRKLEHHMGLAAAETSSPRIAPATPVQEVIAKVWREVLGVQEVGIDDNFFEIGGHSLLAARVHQRLRDVLDEKLTILDVYQFPTISALERHLAYGESPISVMLDDARSRGARRREQRDVARAGRLEI